MSTSSELLALPVSSLLALMKARKISPVELMEATLDKAEQINPTTSAFITIAGEEAMKEARRFEGVYIRGGDLPPLTGLPISVKDTEATKGIRTTFGSAIFQNNVPDFDGAAAANLKRSGAIVFAKSNTPAFAHKGNTDNLLRAPARNPVRLSDTPGGSSGGAAAAVAAGIGPVAHGTDGAGSVRLPASLCGLVGFKPGYGRVPYWPIADLWAARAHHGVLSRTLEDAVLTMRGLAGPNAHDPLSDYEQIDWLCQPDLKTLGAKRGLYLPQFGPGPADPVVSERCGAAVRKLRDAGLVIEEGIYDLPPTSPWHDRLWHPQLAKLLKPWRKTNPELVDASLIEPADAGESVSLEQYLDAREERTKFHAAFIRRFSDVDYIICPTMPCLSWPIDGTPVLHDGRKLSLGTEWDQLHVFNLLGWPAISMPCGRALDGRTIGIQIVTKRNEDLLCLAIASVLETITAENGFEWEEAIQ